MSVIERIEKGELNLCCKVSDQFEKSEYKELLRLAKLGQQMQWVSVAEGLPRKDQLVLVIKGSWFNLKTFCIDNDGEQSWYDYVLGESCEIKEYTHWMPLPPNPKEAE